jgi:hypothetical protein
MIAVGISLLGANAVNECKSDLYYVSNDTQNGASTTLQNIPRKQVYNIGRLSPKDE